MNNKFITTKTVEVNTITGGTLFTKTTGATLSVKCNDDLRDDSVYVCFGTFGNTGSQILRSSDLRQVAQIFKELADVLDANKK